MNSKRKTMLVAAFVVAVVALAGVGYATAVTGYKATTSVDGNAVSQSQFITIYPTSGTNTTNLYTAAFTGEYVFDTVNENGMVKLSNTCKPVDGTSLGTAITLDDAYFTYSSNDGFQISNSTDGTIIGALIGTITNTKIPLHSTFGVDGRCGQG